MDPVEKGVQNDTGSIKITDEVVAIIAGIAANGVAGGPTIRAPMTQLRLEPARPNPFKQSTTISF
ncbi:MAG: hypothetical protein PHX37_05485, partial [Eubacteriales bacterium]|nr:hypothetical protein [Eubacteriales bacterium]